MMFDVIEMMHSLSNRSFSDLEAIGAFEGVHVCNKCSKIELICAIIANRAANPIKHNNNKPTKDNRKKYCLHCREDDYYLELTKEQVSFADWCIDHSIDFDFVNIDEMNNIEWEMP